MKNHLIIISLIITMFLLSGCVIYIYNLYPKAGIDIKHYHIIYYHSNYIYEVETTKENIEVRKKGVVECFQAPCDPIVIDSFTVAYQDTYINLFEELFDGVEEERIVLYDYDLNQEQKKVFFEILREPLPKEVDDLSYDILGTTEDYSSKYLEKGYYIEYLSNGKVLLTVSMGEQSTGGYQISIVRVLVNGNRAKVYVEEESPSKNDDVIDVLTTPITQVEFSNLPDNITVQNIMNGQNYQPVHS